MYVAGLSGCHLTIFCQSYLGYTMYYYHNNQNVRGKSKQINKVTLKAYFNAVCINATVNALNKMMVLATH